MRNLIFVLLFSLISVAFASEGTSLKAAENTDQISPHSSSILNRAREHLYAGTAEAGENELSKISMTEDNRGDLAFALGMLRSVVAVERLGRKLKQHGFSPDPAASDLLLGSVVLLFPKNKADPPSEVLTYEKWRWILASTVADLDRVEQTFALIGDKPVAFRIDPLKIKLNINGKAQGIGSETLWQIAERISVNSGVDRKQQKEIPIAEIDFDNADAFWIRGYTNLISAHLQFLLAHDHSISFPYMRQLFFIEKEPKQVPREKFITFIALIHSIRWPVIEPEHLVDAHNRLKKMIGLSRESWKVIRQRAQGPAIRWIPGPGQKGVLNMPVTEETVNAWHNVLDLFEDVLDGKKLAPAFPWLVTDKSGLNVKRMLFEHKTFDLVFLLTGQDAYSFFEKGEVISEKEWQKAGGSFRGSFFAYALWFN